MFFFLTLLINSLIYVLTVPKYGRKVLEKIIEMKKNIIFLLFLTNLLIYFIALGTAATIEENLISYFILGTKYVLINILKIFYNTTLKTKQRQIMRIDSNFVCLFGQCHRERRESS